MSELSRNIHSVIFGSKNTWDDWHLIPVKRPFIVNPPTKFKSIDLIGASGELDYTTALTGYPVYGNRKNSLMFRIVDAKDQHSAQVRRDEIASYLHGRYRQLTLEDQPDYYYQGRFELVDNSYKGKGDWADIEISYNLEPFKYYVTESTEDWLWDPFSFENGVIQKAIFAGIETDSDTWIYINDLVSLVGDMPVYPVIKVVVDSGKTIQIQTYNTRDGAWSGSVTYSASTTDADSGLVFDVNTTRVRIKGYGTVDITFRTGRL